MRTPNYIYEKAREEVENLFSDADLTSPEKERLIEDRAIYKTIELKHALSFDQKDFDAEFDQMEEDVCWGKD